MGQRVEFAASSLLVRQVARCRHFCILLLPGKSMASGGTRPADFEGFYVFRLELGGWRLEAGAKSQRSLITRQTP
jgi:hypothetical protein